MEYVFIFIFRNQFSINNSMFYNSFQLHAEEVISKGKSYKPKNDVIKIVYITGYAYENIFSHGNYLYQSFFLTF